MAAGLFTDRNHPFRSGIMRFCGILIAVSIPVAAEMIMQEGDLSGDAGDANEHRIVLDQFDTLGKTRVLQWIELQFSTTLHTAAFTNGEGGFVDIESSLAADYGYSGGALIAETAGAISSVADDFDLPMRFSS